MHGAMMFPRQLESNRGCGSPTGFTMGHDGLVALTRLISVLRLGSIPRWPTTIYNAGVMFNGQHATLPTWTCGFDSRCLLQYFHIMYFNWTCVMSRSKPHRFTFMFIDRMSKHKTIGVRCVRTTWFDSAIRYVALRQNPPGTSLFDVISVSVAR
jgi:hypothetical protein